MRTKISFLYLGSLLLILLSLIPLHSPQPALALDSELSWTVVNTPGSMDFVVLSPSEINVIAVGADDKTVYALDASGRAGNKYIYKSEDNGATWVESAGSTLLAKAGFTAPVWNMAVAPDNAEVLAAVTTAGGLPGEVFISEDGGDNWEQMNLASKLAAGEQVGAIDISPLYGNGWRDVAVGTRTMGGNGNVYVYQKTTSGGGWRRQDKDTSWAAADVIAIKFVPAYTDEGLAVIVSTLAGTYLNLGQRDIGSNDTGWNAWGYTAPGKEVRTAAGTSPTAAQILTADLEMPSDFTPGNPLLRRFYLCYDDSLPASYAGVYRREDDEDAFYQMLTETTTPGGYQHRFSSIAYFGSYDSGVLLAGEVTSNPATGNGNLWITTKTSGSNTYAWTSAAKPPSGGFGSGLCNMQLVWNPDGTRAYCGTSSANLLGMGWPGGYTSFVSLDESAFSLSPYSAVYRDKVTGFDKNTDSTPGNLWNGIGLIDTEIKRFSDVAALEVPDGSTDDYNILYLASYNSGGADSIWRSVTDEIGYRWERILCHDTDNNDIILRVYAGNSFNSRNERSDFLVFADRQSMDVQYSYDEGQSWDEDNQDLVAAYDVAVEGDRVIYIADNSMVRRGSFEDNYWDWEEPVSTGLSTTHTIYALPQDAQAQNEDDPEKTQKWVAVSDEDSGTIALCDFGEDNPRFTSLPAVPLQGRTHVILHDRFTGNNFIFAAVSNSSTLSGKLYRWTLGQSGQWLDLLPPDKEFYGLALDQDVLYGLWRYPTLPEIVIAGADRTLHASHTPPPLMEWDSLTYNIPESNTPLFMREPSALKISRNDEATLWALDNRDYDFAAQQGCLWAYTDTLATRAPWPTNPALGAFIYVDPVTGRADEINFQWLELSKAGMYQLQVAKDAEFTKMVLEEEGIVPFDQTSPNWILKAGNLLEAGHTYYWRLRVVGSILGEKIRSPWSATMQFTVMAGLAVNTPYYGPILLAPEDDDSCPCGSAVAFSWSPYKETRKYLFELSESEDMGSPFVSEEVSTTAYEYGGRLKCNSVYYWRVQALEPFPSDWSATFSFKTGAETSATTPAKDERKPGTPIPVPAIIGMVAVIFLLFFFILVLVFKTRHMAGTTPVWRTSRLNSSSASRKSVAKYVSGLKREKSAQSNLNTGQDTAVKSNAGFFSKILMWLRRRRYLSGEKSGSKFFRKGK